MSCDVTKGNESGREARMPNDPLWEELTEARVAMDYYRVQALARKGIEDSLGESDKTRWFAYCEQLVEALLKAERPNQCQIDEAIAILEQLDRELPVNKQKMRARVKHALAEAFSSGSHLKDHGALVTSLGYCEQARSLYQDQQNLSGFASVCICTATAYEAIGAFEGPDRIDDAIQHTEEARRSYVKADLPRDVAGAEVYLAHLYYARTLGSMEENTARAIRYYEQAAAFFTRERFPEEFAIIMEGIAIYHLNRGTGSGRLDSATPFLTAALEVFKQLRLEDDVSRIESTFRDIKAERQAAQKNGAQS